jgi:hypothetical protein
MEKPAHRDRLGRFSDRLAHRNVVETQSACTTYPIVQPHCLQLFTAGGETGLRYERGARPSCALLPSEMTSEFAVASSPQNREAFPRDERAARP